VDDDATDIPIVRLVTSLAHELGMTVIAEGVETPHQQRLLRAAGCDYCQGYHIARPMPMDALTEWMVGRMHAVVVGSL
jgi:EAL domain-containing protein (putative c-di-GMP-specific phosphodiesterase class I)